MLGLLSSEEAHENGQKETVHGASDFAHDNIACVRQRRPARNGGILMDSDRKVFATFLGEESLRESGRLLYSLLFSFLSADYEVHILSNIRQRLTEFYKCGESDLPEPAQLALSLKGLKFADRPPANARDFVYLYDKPWAEAKDLSWRKRVIVRYDLFSPYRLRAPIIAPYPMHPSQTRWARPEALTQYRAMPRQIRVLFAGDSHGYARNRVRYPGPKLPRLEVLTIIKERLSDNVISVSSIEDFARSFEAGFITKFVLSDSGTGIDPALWLPTLARADFFLCPPGIVMPMCHNVVEAMAVGTIPIISYPEWLRPNLKHMTNCLVFGETDDLVEKMRLAFSMDQQQIEKMRANVINYYDSYLQPDAVVRELEARVEHNVTLLLHTELNMAKNCAKLNRNSVLMEKGRSDGPLRWLTRFVDRHRLSRLGR